MNQGTPEITFQVIKKSIMSTFSEEDLNKSFRGVVTKWFPGRHFGFITANNNGQEVFLGKHEWPESIDPKINTIAEFSLGKNGKGWAALKCQIESPSTATEIATIPKVTTKVNKKVNERNFDTKLKSLKKLLKKGDVEDNGKLSSSKEELSKFGQFAPKASGTIFYTAEDLNTVLQANEFYHAMKSWASASGNVFACRDLSVVFVSQMEDYRRSIVDCMFSGLSVTVSTQNRAKDLWHMISSTSRSFGAVAEILCESNNNRLSKDDELLCTCFETCIQNHSDMLWVSKAAWILLHASRSQSLCPSNFLNGFILVNWYLVEVVSLPFPLAFNFDLMSEEVNDQLRDALTADDEIMLAHWILKEFVRQWVEFDRLVQDCVAENTSLLSPSNMGGLKAAARAPTEDETIQNEPNDVSTLANSAREEEEHAHEIVVSHRRQQRADQCFICMDDNVRPTISLLCCGQPCHIKCMEKWYASKPNLVGREKCPQCTQEIPEPMLTPLNSGASSHHNTTAAAAAPHAHAPRAAMMYTSQAPLPYSYHDPAAYALNELLHAQAQGRSRTARASSTASATAPTASSRSRSTLVSHPHSHPMLTQQSATTSLPHAYHHYYSAAPFGVSAQPAATAASSSVGPSVPPNASTTSSGANSSSSSNNGNQRYRTVMVPMNDYYVNQPVMMSSGAPYGHANPSPAQSGVAAPARSAALFYPTHNGATPNSFSGVNTDITGSRSSAAPVYPPFYGHHPAFTTTAANGTQLAYHLPSHLAVHPSALMPVNPTNFARSRPSPEDPNHFDHFFGTFTPPPPSAPSTHPASGFISSEPGSLPLVQPPSSSVPGAVIGHLGNGNHAILANDRSVITEFDQLLAHSSSRGAVSANNANQAITSSENTLPLARDSAVRATVETTTVIPMNPHTEELLRPLRNGQAPAIQPSLHSVPQSPLCQHCGVALRAVECTNFHCGRCCQRVGALNCLRHHVTQVAANGAIVLTSAAEEPHGRSGLFGEEEDDDVEHDEEDIYDLRPDPEILTLSPRNHHALSAVAVDAAVDTIPMATTDEYFQFPALTESTTTDTADESSNVGSAEINPVRGNDNQNNNNSSNNVNNRNVTVPPHHSAAE